MANDDLNSLQGIGALARAGALEEAWSRFSAAGFDRDTRPAALALQGRLLKDKALRATGAARVKLFREAAKMYAHAAQNGSTTYPLINAATLSLLSDDLDGAASFAGEILRRLSEEPDEFETPYYHAATRAEALLLLRREHEAAGALRIAIALAPNAWEDHASTIRQFELILTKRGSEADWLDDLRPPRSVHFGGHMSFRSDVSRHGLLGETVTRALEVENVGFAFGALAAGADIIIAEALLERGGELHLIVPGGPTAFAARSVDPFGPEWRRRYDAVLERAEAVRLIRPLAMAPDAETIAVADEVAMGAALMNARRLESSAVQLLVVDNGAAPEPSATYRAQVRWAQGGWRQWLIPAPREAVAPTPAHDTASSSSRRAMAVLSIRFAEQVEGGEQGRLATLRTLIDRLSHSAHLAYFSEDAVMLAFENLLSAADVGLRLASADYRIGGDYLATTAFTDPFSGAQRLPGSATAAASAAAASTPPGSVCVTEDFAAALAVAGDAGPHSEYVGELDPPDEGPPIALYALKPRISSPPDGPVR
ncbi:tetratricopeptide repeat-containing protein [Sphingosinicella sp. BN140058]|uniref:tetratricopeptide repeat-containing protein n=1 Tax=Sphingosinicella sp. BN140058 TaxID=1892855 RepID=UPI0010108FEA|nr:tetratricopeptide repeat-containing protein [Sphingosinicella sp. BN140058]QAY77382.1 hypothetical protein ETR14_13355 [Sphingosinicella sp. BN140058]